MRLDISLTLILLLVGLLFLLWRDKKMAEDFTALNAAISKLQADVATLIASKTQTNQAAIDSATAAVNAVDASVVAATPAPPAA